MCVCVHLMKTCSRVSACETISAQLETKKRSVRLKNIAVNVMGYAYVHLTCSTFAALSHTCLLFSNNNNGNLVSMPAIEQFYRQILGIVDFRQSVDDTRKKQPKNQSEEKVSDDVLIDILIAEKQGHNTL